MATGCPGARAGTRRTRSRPQPGRGSPCARGGASGSRGAPPVGRERVGEPTVGAREQVAGREWGAEAREEAEPEAHEMSGAVAAGEAVVGGREEGSRRPAAALEEVRKGQV